MMSKMQNIRDTFIDKFNLLASKENILVLDKWYEISFEDDNMVCSWYSAEKKRGMILDESDKDNGIIFDSFTYRGRGENEDITELAIFIINSKEYVETVFELYKKWFFSNTSQDEIDKMLIINMLKYNS